MARTGNENVLASASASASSRRGKLGESAMTARNFSPSASCATRASKAESTPPEYATRQEPQSRNNRRNRSSLFAGTTSKLAFSASLVESRKKLDADGDLGCLGS